MFLKKQHQDNEHGYFHVVQNYFGKVIINESIFSDIIGNPVHIQNSMKTFIDNIKCFSKSKFEKKITCFFLQNILEINIHKILIYNCFNTLNAPGIIVNSNKLTSFIIVNLI